MATMTFSAPAALPPGRYPATLLNIGEGEGKFGAYLDWEFTVSDPDGKVKSIDRRTSCKTGGGSIARELVEALLGRSVQLDEKVDLDGLIGRTCDLEIAPNANGYDSIVNATPTVPAGVVTADDIAF